MGNYLNPGNDMFYKMVHSEIYVDKTGLIGYCNRVINTMQRYICVSRPRRFGKSMAANMLSAYYSRECDSEKLKKGDLEDFRPAVFLFGAKSAPSYFRAKGIIKFINEIAKKIAADDRVNKKLQVVFVTDYNVSYAEKIVAGSDVSLQVSTAGLEASGTGNMKFMMNGAVTCGTMDGANIEIVEQAGRENNYIFGADVEEIKALSRGKYDPNAILKSDCPREMPLRWRLPACSGAREPRRCCPRPSLPSPKYHHA